jgi:hypothetical protein
VVYFLSALGAIALRKTVIIFPMACALWHGWEVWREKGCFQDLAVHVATLGVVRGVAA